jgi:hypothetical protein
VSSVTVNAPAAFTSAADATDSRCENAPQNSPKASA